MSDRALAVHKAVLTALKTGLAPVPVYDHVPPSAAYPFVDLTSQEVTHNPPVRPLNLEPVNEHRVYLTVWSSHRGQQQVLDILGKIRAALDHVTLTLEAGKCVLCHLDSSECRLDADGATYQGSAVVRLITI